MVVFAEGEDVRVLRAAQFALEDGIAQPILVGRPAVLEARIAKAGLRLKPGQNIEIVNPDDDPRFRHYWTTYHKLMGRRGISPEAAKGVVNRSPTTIAALMVRLGDADAMLCGLNGRFDAHLAHIHDIIGIRDGERSLATLNGLMMNQRTLFIADTYVNETPSSELLAYIALQAAREVRLFGLCRRSRSCRIRITDRPGASRPSACARPTSSSRSSRPTSNATARCMAMPRCPRPSASRT